MSDFQTWYADPKNAAWYHQTTGTPAPKPAAVDWAALKQLNDAGLTSDQIRRLGSQPKAQPGRVTTQPVAGGAPYPGSTTNTGGGSGGSGTSDSGRPTGQGGAVLVRDNMGKYFVVNFSGSSGGTRQQVDPTQLADAEELYGPAITNVNQLPAHIRNAQTAKFGNAGGGAIALDVRLGFYDGGPWDADAAKSEDDEEGADHRSAHAMIREVLEQYGLGGLSDWAWQMLQSNRSSAEVLLELRNQPLFKERFKAIDIRRANGLNPVSPETIIEYENVARDLMRSSGLPPGFYDDADDFAELIGKGVSLQSVQKRVEDSWNRVVNAPAEVRDAFFKLYGAKSDQALAAFMFDPDKSEVKLKEMAQTAVAGGAMRSFGFDLDVAAAGRIAGFDFDDAQVRSGMGKIAQLRAVFEESRGERNAKDLDAMREGANAVFDMGEGQLDIERRVLTRRSEFGGGGGGLLSNQGLTGAGRR